MAGRWKVGANGQREWEELADGVSAPDQIAGPSPTEGGDQNMGSPKPGVPPSSGNADDQTKVIPSPYGNAWDPSRSSEGPGGITGRAQDPLFGQLSAYASEDNAAGKAANASAGAGGALPSAYTPATSPAPGENTGQPQADPVPEPQAGNAAPPAPTTSSAPEAPAPTAAASNRPAPPGFDQSKWNDQTQGTSNKYKIGRMVDQMIGQGASNEAVMSAVLAANPGTTQVGSDSIRFPDGVTEDLIFDSDGAGRRAQYTETGGGSGGGSGSGAGASGGHSGGGSPFGGGSQFGGGIMGGALSSMFADGMSSQGGDPISDVMRSARAQADVATSRSRAALAERAAQEGLNSGGQGGGYFDSAVQGQIEDEGRNLSGMEANMRYQELNNKRQMLVQALQLAQGQERIDLQGQLQQMNNEMSKLQLGQQNSQFYDTMGYNMGRDQSDNDFRYLQMLMGGGA